MSTTETITTEVVVVRAVDFDVGTDGDGRTLYARVVPFDTLATVSDPPDYVPYEEMWARSAFDKQLKAPQRVNVLMNFEHERGIGGVVGRGVQLRAEQDGLHGTFRFLNTQDADKAIELVRENVLSGMSLEAVAKISERVDGVVVRKVAHLRNVALCRDPAFKEAQVLAVRQENGDGGDVDRQKLPEGMADLPAGVTHCVMNGTAGYKGGEGGACHMHDGSQESMMAAMTKAKTDASPRRSVEMPPPLNVERLEALGVDIVHRAFVDKPWDGSAGRWPDAASYCRSCLVDNNPAGAEKTKEQCHFPVKDPGSSDYNVAALRAVVGGRGAQANFPGAEAARATARRLLAQYQNQRGNG